MLVVGRGAGWGIFLRVLVGWASEASPNLGVGALARGSQELIHQAWPGADITFMDFSQRPGTMPWGRVRSLLRERAAPRYGMMDWLSQFDLYWDTRSGDSFADIYGVDRHLKMSLVHDFAVQAGVPAVMAPQTIGPFTTRRGRVIARRSLHRSRFVFARDPRSAEAASRLGRSADRLTSDVVFAITQPTPSDPHDVLLNVSGLLWEQSDHADADRYRTSMRTIIDRLLASGREVTVFAHVIESKFADTDVPVALALADEYDGKVGLCIPRDLDDARRNIASAQLVIGARMHACLNALSVGTPAIAIAYSRKFQPLLDAIEWPHVIAADDPDAADQVLGAAARVDLEGRAQQSRELARASLEDVPGLIRSLA